MSEVRRAGGALLVAAGLTVLGPRSASAQEPSLPQGAACVHHYETAQEDRLRNDLLSARSRLVACVGTCPSPFREQCTTWRTEIERFMSSIRVRVVTPDGRAQVVRRGHVDARPFDLAEEIFLVPGEHILHVEVGDRALTKRIVTKPEQHGVVVDIVMEPQSSTPDPGGDANPRAAGAEARASRLPSIVAFSAGGASLVTALSLGVYGHVRRSELSSSCEPRCAPDRVDSIATAWWVAGGFAFAGAIGVVAGVVLWPSQRATVTASAGSVDLELRF